MRRCSLFFPTVCGMVANHRLSSRVAVWLVSCLSYQIGACLLSSLETLGWDLQRHVLKAVIVRKAPSRLTLSILHSLYDYCWQTLSPRLTAGGGASSATIAALSFELCLLLTPSHNFSLTILWCQPAQTTHASL